jgi:hypothetical protein
VSGLKDRWDSFSKKTHPLLLWGGLLVLAVLGFLFVSYVTSLVFPGSAGMNPFGSGGQPQMSDNQTTMLFVIQPLALIVFGLLFLGSLFKLIDYAADRIFKRDVPMMREIAVLLGILIVLFVIYTTASSLLNKEPVIGTFKQADIPTSSLINTGDTITFNNDHTFVNHRYGLAGYVDHVGHDVNGTWSKENAANNKSATVNPNPNPYTSQYNPIVPAGNQYLLVYDLEQGTPMSSMEYVAVSTGNLTFFAPLDVSEDITSLLYPSMTVFRKQ